MSAAPPLAFRWDGEAMRPLRPKACAAAYEPGIYWLEPTPERSWHSHAHQFAWLKEAWENLPESLSDQFPSPEHLRKWALIDTGWHRESVIDAGSRAAALRVAAYARGEDVFAHVVTRGSLVVIRKARSQAMHGHDRMSRAEFQTSKDAIMTRIARLIGVSPEDFGRAA
jgi:hypothetical protein